MNEEISLSNSDHLQLLFDYKIKKEGGSANTSQLLIELDSPISADELKKHLLSNEYFNQLVNTSLIRPFIGKEKYRFNESQELLFSEVNAEKIIYATVFGADFLGTDPVKVTLIQLPKKSAVLIQVNHIFIDNNGVKNILRSFSGEKFDFHRTITSEERSFFNRLKNGFQFTRLMMKKWKEPITHIPAAEKKPVVKDYIIHDFTQTETKKIESKIKRSYHIKSMSSLLMAATCKAIKDYTVDNGRVLRKFSFQQPAELTRKREAKFILGNRFSFIFYRLKPDQISTIDDIQDELNKQTMQQMKEGYALKSLDLQSILRFINLRLHLGMINLPARGKMTTFAYTYIGESKIINEFAGRKISNMLNIPPVMKNPPITIGSVLYDGNLRIQLCYDTTSISKEDANVLINSIKRYLLEEV